MKILEVIVQNKEDALAAQLAGADRLEGSRRRRWRGWSPDFKVVEEIIKSVEIPVNVMLRFQGQSFIYLDEEMDKILKYLEELKELPINGLVFGSLRADELVDEDNLRIILNQINNLDLTFHRAIDHGNKQIENLTILNNYEQVKTILTSGGLKDSIEKNSEILNAMIINSNKQLLLGGGINKENYQDIINDYPTADIHIGSLAYNQKDFSKGINKQMIREIKSIMKRWGFKCLFNRHFSFSNFKIHKE